MIHMLQALTIVSLLPVLEVDVLMSRRIKALSDRDDKIGEMSEKLSSICSEIQDLNFKLSSLNSLCLANINNPVAQATLRTEAQMVLMQQNILSLRFSTLAQSNVSRDFIIQSSAPVREPLLSCKIPGKLRWPLATIAILSSESGGSAVKDTPSCQWNFSDKKVLPL